MNTLDELNGLIEEIDSEVSSNLDNISDNKGYHYIEWCDYLKKVKSRLEIKRYKFVFIGQKGIGKTTTILEMFGLSKKEGLKGLDNKFVDLLSTASGGTTTCEVEIFKSDTDYTYFQIEPIANSLFNQYIDDFCSSYDNSGEKFDDTQYLPTEINRSLRNMIGLKKTDIIAIRETYKSNDEFKQEILRRIDRDNRTETIIKCNEKGGSYFMDCKDKFTQINLCKIHNVFLPSKINLYLTRDIMDFDKYPILSSIVDTRGIDTVVTSGTNTNKMKRKDILNYIDKDENNCLFFFIDNIKPAPSQNITDLLKTRMTSANAFRFFILINILGNEAEEVMTDDGKAESEIVGIEYKKDDILSKFKQINIPFIDLNLIFFNARLNRPERVVIFDSINNSINTQRDYVYKICSDIKVAFEKTKYDFENNKYALMNFEQLKELIENIKTPKDVFNNVLMKFLSELQPIHHARIAAINRVHGKYWAFDYFHEISLVIENIFDSYFSNNKEKIVSKVKEFLNYRNVSELHKLNYKVFLDKFENDYNKYRNELKDSLKEKLQNFFKNETWEKAINEYGIGPGYKDRVLRIYTSVLNEFAEQNDVKNNYDKEWWKIINENSLS
ncbi:MAG: hypothetical protein LBC51_11045 [Treponema sp.]|nr:hypothetical protein [Treponema sp.]